MNVCKSTKGKLIFETINHATENVRFSYNPLDYIANHLTACLEDGHLIMKKADKENALKSCFSEDSEDRAKMFYFLQGAEIPLKLGSNSITQETQENIKNTKNLHFEIRHEDKTKEFDINEGRVWEITNFFFYIFY